VNWFPLTPRARRIAWVAGVAFALGFGLLFPVLRGMRDDNDFGSFWAAGRHVWQEGRLDTYDGVERYLPVFQTLHVPLGLLPAAAAAAVWYLLSLAALWALPREIQRLSGVAPREQWPAWAVLGILLLDNLALGQSAPVLLFLTTWGVARAQRGRALAGGLAIGLAGLFKVIPAATLGVPVLLRRASGALAGFALAVALGFGATVALVGVENTAAETRRWAIETREMQSSWGLVEHGKSLRYKNQGLGVILARTLGDLGDTPATGAVRLASWPWPVVWTLYGLAMAALLAVGARAALAARRLPEERAWFRLYALSTLGMLLAAPLVWTHYYVWALPALVLLGGSRRALLWGGIAFNVVLFVPPLRALGFHAACAVALYTWIARSLWRDAAALETRAARGQP
jgi:hypothetical protein